MNGGGDGAQAVGADRLADGLFRAEEFVDVGLGEADRLGEIGDRRLVIAVAAEMRVGRLDDLVADAVIGGAAQARRRGRWKVAHAPYLIQRVAIDNE